MEDAIKQEDIEKAGNSLILYSCISLLFNALNFSTENIHDFPVIVKDQKLTAGVVTVVVLYFFLYFLVQILRSYLLHEAAMYSKSFGLVEQAVKEHPEAPAPTNEMQRIVISGIQEKIRIATTRYRLFTWAFFILTQFVPCALGILALVFGFSSMSYMFAMFFKLL